MKKSKNEIRKSPCVVFVSGSQAVLSFWVVSWTRSSSDEEKEQELFLIYPLYKSDVLITLQKRYL